jgi:hypothetical protein
MAEVESGGVRISYEAVGEGRPLRPSPAISVSPGLTSGTASACP